MWWFGGNPSPSDYPNAAIPNFNMHAFVIFSVFLIPLIAYILILPGVRRKRVVTTVTYVLMLAVGGALIGNFMFLFLFYTVSVSASLIYPCWASGSQMIYTQFRGHSNERILAKIGVEIGLQKVNVTLKFERLLSSNDVLPGSDMTELYYNEGFDISGISSMAEALHHGLENGLPYPMLSVLEYFSLNQDSFDWGRHYRVAGHYTHAAIWFAFACWCLSVVLMLFLPHNAYKTTNSSRDKNDISSDKTAGSSGFQSRTSTCQSSASSASLRSQSSIETVHDEAELERTHVHFLQEPCSSSST